MASWMGPNGREGVLDLIRQRLDDQTLEDPTPRILRRFLEDKLGLKEFELDDDGAKQQIKEMINEVLQEEDEPELLPKKSVAKSSKAKTREPKEVRTSMPKSSPLYTNLRKLCQAASLNPNKLINSSMYLPEKVSALKKALIDAGFKPEQLKSDTILETIEVTEASRFAKENVEESIAPRGRRRAAAAVDYKAIFAKETAGIEGIDSEQESEEDVEEEDDSEEDEGFSINESAEEDASESSASEEESEVEEKPRKRSTRNNPRATGRGRRKQESSEEDEEEDEDEEEEEEEPEEEEEEEELSEEQSEESAPKKKKLKKN